MSVLLMFCSSQLRRSLEVSDVSALLSAQHTVALTHFSAHTLQLPRDLELAIGFIHMLAVRMHYPGRATYLAHHIKVRSRQ